MLMMMERKRRLFTATSAELSFMAAAGMLTALNPKPLNSRDNRRDP